MSCETVKRNSEFTESDISLQEEEYAEVGDCPVREVEDDIEVEVPDIASAYRNRMKVADLQLPGSVAIFINAKADVEAAESFCKNDMEVVRCYHGCSVSGRYHAG